MPFPSLLSIPYHPIMTSRVPSASTVLRSRCLCSLPLSRAFLLDDRLQTAWLFLALCEGWLGLLLVGHSSAAWLCFQIPGTCLLPEVTEQDQGRICVVIDLDETLVHSSFKVSQRGPSLGPV